MTQRFLAGALAVFGALIALPAAELKFDFALAPENAIPTGFRSEVAGVGPAGDWKVIATAVPSALGSFDPGAESVSRRRVLAQLSTVASSERFPLLVYEKEVFGDFTLTTRFQCVSGTEERMAGIAFRLQDPANFYVVRASSLGGNVRFYKVVNGVRSAPIGNAAAVPAGTWLTLKVECRGSHIRAWLNDAEVIPELTDTSFTKGRLAFWTMSDSVSYFSDTVVNYVPNEMPAHALVRQTLKEYPRLLALKVFAPSGPQQALQVIASKNDADVGQAGGVNEQEVMANGQPLVGRGDDGSSVLMPLRDRNGDIVAVVRLLMKGFPGQTEVNVLVRAQPTVKFMQNKVQERKDLVDE